MPAGPASRLLGGGSEDTGLGGASGRQEGLARPAAPGGGDSGPRSRGCNTRRDFIHRDGVLSFRIRTYAFISFCSFRQHWSHRYPPMGTALATVRDDTSCGCDAAPTTVRVSVIRPCLVISVVIRMATRVPQRLAVCLASPLPRFAAAGPPFVTSERRVPHKPRRRRPLSALTNPTCFKGAGAGAGGGGSLSPRLRTCRFRCSAFRRVTQFPTWRPAFCRRKPSQCGTPAEARRVLPRRRPAPHRRRLLCWETRPRGRGLLILGPPRVL